MYSLCLSRTKITTWSCLLSSSWGISLGFRLFLAQHSAQGKHKAGCVRKIQIIANIKGIETPHGSGLFPMPPDPDSSPVMSMGKPISWSTGMLGSVLKTQRALFSAKGPWGGLSGAPRRGGWGSAAVLDPHRVLPSSAWAFMTVCQVGQELRGWMLQAGVSCPEVGLENCLLGIKGSLHCLKHARTWARDSSERVVPIWHYVTQLPLLATEQEDPVHSEVMTAAPWHVRVRHWEDDRDSDSGEEWKAENTWAWTLRSDRASLVSRRE